MTYSYTSISPNKTQRDPSRSKERKEMDQARRSARRTKRAVRSMWGF